MAHIIYYRINLAIRKLNDRLLLSPRFYRNPSSIRTHLGPVLETLIQLNVAQSLPVEVRTLMTALALKPPTLKVLGRLMIGT